MKSVRLFLFIILVGVLHAEEKGFRPKHPSSLSLNKKVPSPQPSGLFIIKLISLATGSQKK